MCGGVQFNNNTPPRKWEFRFVRCVSAGLVHRCRMETEHALCCLCRLCTLEEFPAAAVQWKAAPLLLDEMESADRQAESRHVCTPLSLSLVTHCDNTAM